MQVERFTNYFYSEMPYRGGKPMAWVCYWIKERDLTFWFGNCNQLVIERGLCRDVNEIKSEDLEPVTLDVALVDEIEKTLAMKTDYQNQMATTSAKIIAATPPET